MHTVQGHSKWQVELIILSDFQETHIQVVSMNKQGSQNIRLRITRSRVKGKPVQNLNNKDLQRINMMQDCYSFRLFLALRRPFTMPPR
jgi:hypothetical protein